MIPLTVARRWFVTKPAKGTSPLGVTFQLVGVAAILVGVHMVYPPASYVLGGVAALFAGEKL